MNFIHLLKRYALHIVLFVVLFSLLHTLTSHYIGEPEAPRHPILDTEAQQIAYGDVTPYAEAEKKPLPFSKLKQALREDRIATVVVAETHNGERTFHVRHRNGDLTTTSILGDEAMLQEVTTLMDKQGVVYAFEKQSPPPSGSFGWIFNLLFLGLMIYLVFFLFRTMRNMQGGGGSGGVAGKGKSLVTREVNPSITLDDVGGVQHLKPQLREVVAKILSVSERGYLGADVPKGYLFIGPPGTGKTLLARAIAGEVAQQRSGGKPVTFFRVSASDFVEMFVGVGASRVRDMFKTLRENSPCILFIDEIDGFGKRGGNGLSGGDSEREQTINQLLVELDGFSPNDGITVIGATNLPDKIDPALTRPGRLDRKVSVPLPDLLGREEILRIHANGLRRKALENRLRLSGNTFESGDPELDKVVNAPLPANNQDLPEVFSSEVDFNTVARETPGCSGADLRDILGRAAELAEAGGQTLIRPADIRNAFQSQVLGDEMPRVMEFVDEFTTSIHEINGHAVIMGDTRKRLGHHHADDIMSMTIIPRGMALGAVWTSPTKDRVSESRKYLEGRLRIAMGGQIAEKLFLGPDEVTSGASSDIAQATKIAGKMISQCAMTDAEGLTFRNYMEDTGFGLTKAQTELVDTEIDRLLDLQYLEATATILSYASATDRNGNNLLEMLTRAMLVKKTLQGEEFMRLLDGEVVFRREDLDLGENEAQFQELWKGQTAYRQNRIAEICKQHPEVAKKYSLSTA